MTGIILYILAGLSFLGLQKISEFYYCLLPLLYNLVSHAKTNQALLNNLNIFYNTINIPETLSPKNLIMKGYL